MSRSLAALLAVSLLACGGESTTEPPPPLGDLALAIVSGQNQTGHAGDSALAKPVDVAVVRAPSGRIVMRVIGDGPTAQTVVNGSPIPGAVVCNHVPDSGPALIPWTECTNSDSTGHAHMFYGMPTQTGTALGIIRGTYQNEPVVFDTAQATVLPGPAKYFHFTDPANHGGSMDDGVPLSVGDSLNLRARLSPVEDQYHNRITDFTLEVAVAPADLSSDPSTWNWHVGDVVHFPEAGDWRAYGRIDGQFNLIWVHVQ